MVFVGGGGPVLDPGGPLEPSERLGPCRQRHPDKRQERYDQRQAETAKQQAMQERREQAPQFEQRDDQKGRDHEEGP